MYNPIQLTQYNNLLVLKTKDVSNAIQAITIISINKFVAKLILDVELQMTKIIVLIVTQDMSCLKEIVL